MPIASLKYRDDYEEPVFSWSGGSVDIPAPASAPPPKKSAYSITYGLDDDDLYEDYKKNRKAKHEISASDGEWFIRNIETGEIDYMPEPKPLTGLERVRNMVNDWVGDIDFAPEEVYA